MATDHLLSERRDGVLVLTLNQPDKLNALSESMLAGLLDELDRAARDETVGAVLLTGAGRGFCSGGDITAMRARNEGGEPVPFHQRVARLRRNEEVSRLLAEIPKVTIAAINGPAAGAGFSIALACDLRVAAAGARMGTAFARVGFSGDFGGTYFLTRLVGPMKARELYFLSEMLSAEEALRLGIVNKVFPDDRLMKEAMALATRIANGPRVAYGYIKNNINRALNADLHAMLDREAETQTLTGDTEDHREGVRAFLEKRQPRFRGR